ncbi:MAG: ATP-binding protein, partial [Pseudomonadales bacterium]
LSPQDLRRATALNEVSLDQNFFFLIPEFQAIEDHRGYLESHRQVWQQLENGESSQLTLAGDSLKVFPRLPTTNAVFAKFGAMFAVAALFASGALVALLRYQNGAGRTAALFLFGASLFALSLPALVTRGLALPYDTLEGLLGLYFLGTCAFAGLIYFPFTFNSGDLPAWVPRLIFWFLLLKSLQMIIAYFSGTAAIAAYLWYTILCVVVFVGRVVQRAWDQRNQRNVTHLTLCYAALVLPTLTFSALTSWPELLVVELGSLQYFVLTSAVVPIAMVSLLESELLQQRNEVQERQLQQQRDETETRSQQARQTVVMNLHDHVARSLDSISALALRARLAGEGNARLDRIREHAMHAHRALRGLFSVSDESCGSWPALRLQMREFGNSLVEQQPLEFQLNDWTTDDAALELDASVKLVNFHVMSEAVTNAVKYGAPSRIVVDIGASEQSFELCVSDDGKGFDPDAVDNSHHHGLNIMRKRAELIDGNLTIESRPGSGTRITLQGPLRPRLETPVTYTPST